MTTATLGQAIDLFLGEYKETTRYSYTYPLVTMRNWIGEGQSLIRLKPELVIEYWQEIIKTRDYAPATEFKHAKTLHVFFNWCVKAGLINKSPSRGIRTRKPPRTVSRDKAMPDADLNALLEHMRFNKNTRDYAMLLFLADTGCRRGGVVGLRLPDVDFARLTASVTEKGEKTYTVAFSQACADAMQYWLKYRAKHYAQSGQDYVFTRNGAPMHANNVSLAIRRACREVGVQVRSAHSLRHRKGHQMSDKGISVSVAATVLGHSDPATTLHYYYPGDWTRAEAASREVMTAVPPMRGAPAPAAPDVQSPASTKSDPKIIQFPGVKHA